MKRKKVQLILLPLSIIFFIFFFKGEVKSQELETVKVYHKPVMGRAPIFIAYEEGFFKEQGIDVELIKTRNIAEAFILLLQGSLDVIVGPPTAGMYNAVKEGKNVEFVAGGTFHVKGNESAGIAIRKDIGTSTDKTSLIKKLKGKKFGHYVLGSTNHYRVEKMFARNGMSVRDVEVVTMRFSSMVGAINKGILDAGHLIEPYITILKSKGEISFIPFSDVFPDSPGTFIIYGHNCLVKDPQLGVRFMAAYLKGCKQYKQGKTKRNLEIIEKYIKLDKEMLKKTSWPVFYPEGIFNAIEFLEDYQGWLLEKGYIDKKISVDSMINTTFIERARKILDNKESK